MAAAPGQFIRIYMRDDEGNLYDTKETLTPLDFCGAIPRAGDCIVSPWLRDYQSPADADEKAKRLDALEHGRLWYHRSIRIVEAVYYRPDKRHADEDDAWVVLVVKERPMTESEWALL